MQLNWKMPAALLSPYNQELNKYCHYVSKGNMPMGWQHLERAHILGQAWFKQHTYVHWLMLRLLLGGIKSFVGTIPLGNSGGANVPPLRAMKIPEDLQKVLAPYTKA